MSDHFYGLDRGASVSPARITVGVATSGQALELRTRDGQLLTRLDVLNAVRCIQAYFEKAGNVPTP